MRILALILGVLLLVPAAWAQKPFTGKLSGRVITAVGDQPIDRVVIDIRGKKTNVAQTDDFGRFEIDLAKVLPEWDGKTINLTFTKKNFFKANRVLTCKASDASLCQEIIVPMVFDYSEFNAEEQELFKRRTSEKGYTLFLIPYEITAPEGTEPLEFKTSQLAEMLFLAITTHLEDLDLAGPLPDIGIKPLEIKLPWTDAERVRQFGHFLNALAMIGGTGEVHRDESGKNLVNVFSRFFTIPQFKEMSASITVQDTLPAESLRPGALMQKINRLWLSQTVLALTLRDYLRAKSVGDRQQLERVRACLIAEKAKLPRNDKALPHIDAMLKLVDKDLQE